MLLNVCRGRIERIGYLVVVVVVFLFLCTSASKAQDTVDQLNDLTDERQEMVNTFERQIFKMMPEKYWESEIKYHEEFLEKTTGFSDFSTQEKRLELPFELRRNRHLVIEGLKTIIDKFGQRPEVDKEILWQNIQDMNQLEDSIIKYRLEKQLEKHKTKEKKEKNKPIKGYQI